MKPIHFLPGAEADAMAAFRFYEERQSGLGDRFEAALSHALSTLEPSARHRVVEEVEGFVVRRAPLGGRFPHRIVFVDLDHEVIVVAVEHPSQRPGYWSERL